MTTATAKERGRLGETVLYFLRLGLLGFGGPVALVGQMERELVSASTFPICAPAFGAPGPAAGRLFFPIL